MATAENSRPFWSRYPPHWKINVAIAAFSATLIVLLWALVASTLRTERSVTIDAAVQRNADRAVALEQYTIRTIESADAIIRFLMREYARTGDKTDLQKFVGRSTIENNSLVGIVLTDELGNAVTTTRSGSYRGNLSDRPHFRIHLDRDVDGPTVGRPVTGRITGKTIIPITRKIKREDGTFGGVAMALIEPTRFTDLVNQAGQRPDDLIALVGYDGITRAKLKGGTASFGEDLSANPMISGQGLTGDIVVPGPLDGVPRLYSYRRLPGYELIVIAGTAESQVMAAFYSRQTRYTWVAGLSTAFILSFAALLMLALARQSQAAAELVRGEARFLATFDQAAIGIAHIGLDGRYLEVNRKLCDILGYSSDELLQKKFTDVTAPEDRPAHTDPSRPLLPLTGKPIAMEREKRYIRKDGTRIWCNITVSPVHDIRGELEYILVVVQNIMDRKQAEEALAARTERLQQLSRELMRAREHEQRRLGRELHDRTGANLSALLLSFEVLRGKFPDDIAPDLASRMQNCESLLRESIAQVRDVLGDLRPPALDELGLLAALNHYVRTVAQAGGCEVGSTGREPVPRLPAEIEISLFRIAQEALNNAIRHANPLHIRISITQDAEAVTLEIADDGQGFDNFAQPPWSARLGLITMRERAEAMNGRFVIEAVEHQGTSIRVRVPHVAAMTPAL